MPIAKSTSSSMRAAAVGNSSTMSKSRFGTSSAANCGKNAEEVDGRDIAKAKNTSKTASDSGNMRTGPNNRPRNENLELDSGDEAVSAQSEKMRAMEARVRHLIEERDAYAGHFDELKAVRQTEAESDLAAYKKAADARMRHSQDLITSLKARVDRTERMLKSASSTFESGEDTEELNASSAGDTEKLRKDFEQLRREKKKADENVRRLELELRTEIESSRKLLSASGSSIHRGAGTALDTDNQAVRRLYEDLTGIVISRVEMCDAAETENGKERRRFTGVFSAAGHHNLQLAFEESCSSLPSLTDNPLVTAPALRQDLIFVPHLDAVRDAELLQSKTLPTYLRDEIRFDRALSVKFSGSLVKGLKM